MRLLNLTFLDNPDTLVLEELDKNWEWVYTKMEGGGTKLIQKAEIFFLFLAALCSMQDLRSLTRDQTRALCIVSTGS